MTEITRENSSLMKRELESTTVVLYGAGTAGRQVIRLLNELQIRADYFADDDPTKQGKLIENLRCLSFAELKELTGTRNVSVILSSVFAPAILERLSTIPVKVYELFAMVSSDCDNALERCLSMKQDLNTWNEKWNRIYDILKDEESKRVWQLMLDAAGGKELSRKRFIAVASTEEHYFVSPIPSLLSDESVLVDCGAYTGDMLGQLARNKFRFKKIYEIEANPVVFTKIIESAEKLNLTAKVVAINCGLFDKRGEMKFWVSKGNAATSCLSNDVPRSGRGGGEMIVVPTRTLEDVAGEKIDFLKMDIEGAELPTLRGAEELLRASRPILAISIYHSLDDVVDIPLWLNDLLTDYRFFVRHHSHYIGETVLYGIPNDRLH